MMFAFKFCAIFLIYVAVNFSQSFPLADEEEAGMDAAMDEFQTLDAEAANQDDDDDDDDDGDGDDEYVEEEPIDNSAKLSPDEDEAQLRDRRVAIVPVIRGIRIGMKLYCKLKGCPPNE